MGLQMPCEHKAVESQAADLHTNISQAGLARAQLPSPIAKIVAHTQQPAVALSIIKGSSSNRKKTRSEVLAALESPEQMDRHRPAYMCDKVSVKALAPSETSLEIRGVSRCQKRTNFRLEHIYSSQMTM